jgi:hypothetical protein
LAQQLSISRFPHQMVRKLEETGWVIYEPHKGVSFTPDGAARPAHAPPPLVEVFLVELLRMAPRRPASWPAPEHTLPAEVASAAVTSAIRLQPAGQTHPRLDPPTSRAPSPSTGSSPARRAIAAIDAVLPPVSFNREARGGRRR